MLDVLEEANDANSKAIHEQRSRVVEVINISFQLVLLCRLDRDFKPIIYSSPSAQVSRRLKQFYFFNSNLFSLVHIELG